MKKRVLVGCLFGVIIAFVGFLFFTRGFMATSAVVVFKLDGEILVKAVANEPRFKNVRVLFIESDSVIDLTVRGKSRAEVEEKMNDLLSFINDWGEKMENRRYDSTPKNMESPVGKVLWTEFKRSLF